MEEFNTDISYRIIDLLTRSCRSSFSNAASWSDKVMREAVFSISGFAGFADEIVDPFHIYKV